MPIDPSIPISVIPANIPTPQAMQASAAKMQEDKLKQQQAQEAAATKHFLDNAMSAAIDENGNIRPDVYAQWVKGTPAVSSLPKLQESVANLNKSQSDAREAALKADAAQDDHRGAIGAQAQAFLDAGNPHAAVAVIGAGFKQAINAGWLKPDDAVSMLSQMDPEDPKSISAFAKSLQAGSKAFNPLQRQGEVADSENATRAAALPGVIAKSAAEQQVTANMQGGLTPDQRADNANQAAQRQQEAQRIELERQRVGLEKQRANAESAATVEIKPGTPEFRIAQDLAYGKMTFAQFRTLAAYNRNIGQKFAIYDKAAQLNPDFNPASFEIGLTLAKNPQQQKQLASLDNVVSGVPDLLAASDAAKRSGATVINKYLSPVKVAIGDQSFTNFRAAQKSFADELSGGLGYGNATDMKLALGIDMTDPNLSPENFASAIQNVIIPFVQRKRASLLKQEGIYGKPGGSAGADVQPPPKRVYYNSKGEPIAAPR